MQHKVTAILYGFLTWLIPFVASLFFFSRQGELTINLSTFKCIMVVVGSFTSTLLLIRYFNRVNKNYFKNGVFVGVLWLAMNIILDLLILIPMSKMTYGDYFSQIGLSYLVIPIYVIGMGYLLEKKFSNKKV